jgi:carbon-monoxide dehydrogenase small subunit
MTKLTLTVSLTVNGKPVHRNVEPRTHLADFLREELLLTGTHLGCEHGVCGACTILLNGAPARSCITFAALCDGAQVQTIEGLHDDPVMVALRAAFTAEHALQCGYCTPGMLATARDIVRRLPEADDDRVRLELAGNLCRCTGYNGIVKAIRRVLDAHLPPAPVVAPKLAVAETIAATPAPAAQHLPNAATLQQVLRLAVPADHVWTAIQDPELVVACVPGARLTRIEGNRLDGEMLASLGPIQARFTGTATLGFDPGQRGGRLVGEARDSMTGTRLSGEVRFSVAADGVGSTLTLDILHALRGPLAQFSRGPIVQVFAADIARSVGRALEARLTGAPPPAPARLRAGRMAMRVLWQLLRRLFGARA